MKALSLFSGCGGLDLGFVRAGGEVVAAYEFDAKACAGYERVMGHSIQQADLTSIDVKSLPDTEGIIGGPPCQAFSLSNSQHEDIGPSSSKNMWPQTLSIVQAKRPLWFVFENVRHMVYSRHSRAYFHELLNILTGYGYRVEYRILNAADYGVPQTRERVFIVGRLDGKAWSWPEETHAEKLQMFSHRWISWKAALADWRSDAQLADIPPWIKKRVSRQTPPIRLKHDVVCVGVVGHAHITRSVHPDHAAQARRGDHTVERFCGRVRERCRVDSQPIPISGNHRELCVRYLKQQTL